MIPLPCVPPLHERLVVSIPLEQRISEARKRLDEQTVDIVQKHFHPERGAPFWLSPLADPLAALRILLSTLRRPTRWRGREYGSLQA